MKNLKYDWQIKLCNHKNEKRIRSFSGYPLNTESQVIKNFAMTPELQKDQKHLFERKSSKLLFKQLTQIKKINDFGIDKLNFKS